MPMFRADAGRPLTTWSPNQMSPASGWANPARSRSSVVLPQPDGPSSVNSSPSSTARSTPSTAGTAPYRFVTPATRILTGARDRGAFVARPARGALLLRLVPPRLDVRAEPGLQRLAALRGHGLVVHV